LENTLAALLKAATFFEILEVDTVKYLGIAMALCIFSTAVTAKHNSEHPLTPEDWKEVMEKVVLLEDSGLLPTLLPVIMRNKDTLQLTDEQVKSFRAWRKANYTNVINTMSEILEKKVQFRVEALSPGVSGNHLIVLQAEIQELQQELLKLKLSCRELVMSTFTEEQWENFAFVVADNPKLASLLPQASAIDPGHVH
jgi:hypothetical protein